MFSRGERFACRCLVMVTWCLIVADNIFAQIGAGGTPPSFTLALSPAKVPTVTLTAPDNATLREQADAEEAQAAAAGTAIPYQVSFLHDVSLNLQNSGTWETLPDGSRLWRLRIVSPDALAMYFLYNRWWLPKGADLFIYNDDHSEVVGAFTSSNNIPDSTNMTAPLTGNALTLEYHLVPGVTNPGELSISTVYHAFRPITHQRWPRWIVRSKPL